MRHGFLRVLCWLVFGLASCQPSTDAASRCRVFASMSLQAPLQAIADELARQQGMEVDLHTAGTPRLTLQLREGASAEVFVSADAVSMQEVLTQRGLEPEAAHAFARNWLAVVTASGNPRNLNALKDLADPELRVALAGPRVPVGRYARLALQQAGVTVSSRSDEPSVGALLRKVQFGELDAAIVYATDLAAHADTLDGFLLPPEVQPEVVSLAAALVPNDHARGAAAQAFVQFLLSAEAQAILATHGFGAAR